MGEKRLDKRSLNSPGERAWTRPVARVEMLKSRLDHEHILMVELPEVADRLDMRSENKELQGVY